MTLGQFFDREFFWIAQVDAAGQVLRAFHKADKVVNQVIDVAEGACLAAGVVDRLALQGLDDEV